MPDNLQPSTFTVPARLRVGVDLVRIDRVARLVERYGARFVERVYTDAEAAYCRGRAESLAARYAAKEATAKLLGTGIGRVAFREIEVGRDGDGRPHLILHGAAARLAGELGLRTFDLSLSHEASLAIAFVVGQ